ncbi:DUF5686 family protein [Porphyromonas sp.]|uniref:DUF5686 family protein n=1 Tax=Porphyromonas sp. TaxID=1924944 RepID=UPI0026DD8A71|nr:DUF5686 family protein [Porphyromonas sp.]MDO4770788.1 DUF5686 family protein [Porphyromonas sp.]
MTTRRSTIYYLIVGGFLLLAGNLRAHAQEFDWGRMERWRPDYPYDEDMGYRLLDVLSRYSSNSKSSYRLLPQIAFGPNISLGEKTVLGLDGIANLIPDYNQIDGVWLGYEVQLSHRLDKGRKLMFRSSQNYTTTTKKWFSENNILYYHSPMRDGLLILSGGRTSRETVHMAPYELFTEQFVGLLGNNSHIRHYAKWYGAIRHKLYLTPRLRYTVLAQWEVREPHMADDPIHLRHRSFVSEAGLVYSLTHTDPYIKVFPSPIVMPAGQGGLEIGLTLRSAIPLSKRETQIYSDYKMWEAYARTARTIAPDHKVDITALAGGFWDQRWQSLSDMKHFARTGIFGRNNFSEAWNTLPDEWMGTSRWFATSANYWSNSFFISRLMAIDEALHFRSLHLPKGQTYLEAGYSIGFGRMGRMGLFLWGDLVHQMQMSLKVSLPFIFLVSTWSERY